MLAAVMSGFRWCMTQILLQVWFSCIPDIHGLWNLCNLNPIFFFQPDFIFLFGFQYDGPWRNKNGCKERNLR